MSGSLPLALQNTSYLDDAVGHRCALAVRGTPAHCSVPTQHLVLLLLRNCSHLIARSPYVSPVSVPHFDRTVQLPARCCAVFGRHSTTWMRRPSA